MRRTAIAAALALSFATMSASAEEDELVSARNPSFAASGGDFLLNLTANPWDSFALFRT